VAVEGAIAERTRGILPVTWDALSLAPQFGDVRLRTTIDTVKSQVFGTVVAPTAESVYPLTVIDYVAKLVALELITPGIDYWMSEPITVSTTGTNETTSYTDRANSLRQLREDLLKETRLLWPTVQPLIGFTQISGAPLPRSSTMDEPFITPSPLEFPRPYRVTDRS
jgi:hypothetical protein